jgi:hypothetical protein
MQQGDARDSKVDCKCAYLLSPSTPGLDAIVCNPEYNVTGITRAENTYKFDKGWTLAEMVEDLRISLKLLAGCLVRCSFQDHLLGMEPFLNRSIVTYFKDAFLFKKSVYNSLVRPAKNGDTYKKDYPDSFTSRWSNRLTGKINGVEANGTITIGRQEEETGWTITAKTAAACSISGADPLLFICVAGLEKHLGEPDSLLKHTYFRGPIPLKRFTTGSKAQLETFFIGTCKNLLGDDGEPRERTWADIGVSPNELRLNPALIPDIRKAKIETELEIPAEFVPEILQHINDSNFDHLPSFAGVAPDRVRKATEFNMPKTASPLTGLAICAAGRSTGRIKFIHEGHSFLIPRPSEDPDKFEGPLKEHILGKTNVEWTFLWGSSGFHIFFRSITNTAAITPQGAVPTNDDSPPPMPTHIGKACTPKDIPLSKQGQEITKARFKLFRGKPHCHLSVRGNDQTFKIPNSLSKKLRVIAKKRSPDKTLEPADFSLNFLIGCKLVKEDNVLISVQGQDGNLEFRMWIVEASGKMLVPQIETNESIKKRQANQISD